MWKFWEKIQSINGKSSLIFNFSAEFSFWNGIMAHNRMKDMRPLFKTFIRWAVIAMKPLNTHIDKLSLCGSGECGIKTGNSIWKEIIYIYI